MYAVVVSGGKQFRVAPGDTIRVEKLSAKSGDSVTLDRVLMVANDKDVRVGTPTVNGASVSATVKTHGRGPKIRIFKLRRRKNSRRTQGHRQDFTELEITGISG
jgi:large subunit ribosomal protein L21